MAYLYGRKVGEAARKTQKTYHGDERNEYYKELKEVVHNNRLKGYKRQIN